MLAWFFDHMSFAGQSAVNQQHFEAYVREVSKPGALRAGINYYAAVWQDAEDNASLRTHRLAMPVLAMGGEASSGPMLEASWRPVAEHIEYFVIPKAGHWIGDENPAAVARRLLEFLA
jgi:pimeloyl-ACP methyl ester carboxylesterase